MRVRIRRDRVGHTLLDDTGAGGDVRVPAWLDERLDQVPLSEWRSGAVRSFALCLLPKGCRRNGGGRVPFLQAGGHVNTDRLTGCEWPGGARRVGWKARK